MEYCAITGDGVVASGEIARLGRELRDGLGVGCACLFGLSRKLPVRQGLPQTLPRRVAEKASGFSCVCGLPRSGTSSHKEILLMLELVCKKSRGINHGLCLLGITFYELVFYIIKLQPFRMPPTALPNTRTEFSQYHGSLTRTWVASVDCFSTAGLSRQGRVGDDSVTDICAADAVGRYACLTLLPMARTAKTGPTM